MHILLATDADWVVDEVTAALGDNETSFTVCREGRLVSELVAIGNIDVVIADLQIGSMGGMAVAMDLRLDASSGAVPETPLVMLLDRDADVFLAQRSGAEAWLVKPLDALRLRKAVSAAVAGDSYTEGVPLEEVVVEASDDAESEPADTETAEAETVDAG
ncbi:MAG: response regulator [Ilumatobacteraceae bacterium]|nr:response regulator [Ilumatobacteraceae bacterium]